MHQNTPAQFAEQLRNGHYNELRVALYFMLKGAYVRIGFQDQTYDLSVLLPDGRRERVEVKWDRASERSGNLYFEVENTRQGKPSGIMATSATLWCHVTGGGREALIAPVALLREILEAGNYRSVKTGGVDSNSRGKLVPISEMRGRQGIWWIKLPTEQEFFGELFRRAGVTE